MIDTLINKLKEVEYKYNDLSSHEKIQRLSSYMNKKVFSTDIKNNIISMITYYTYIKENYGEYYSNQLKSYNSKYINDNIKPNMINDCLYEFMADEKLIDSIFDLTNKDIVEDILNTLREKLQSSNSYKLIYDYFICRVFEFSDEYRKILTPSEVLIAVDDKVKKEIEINENKKVAAQFEINNINIDDTIPEFNNEVSVQEEINIDDVQKQIDNMASDAIDRINTKADAAIKEANEASNNLENTSEEKKETEVINVEDINTAKESKSATNEIDKQIKELELKKEEIESKRQQQTNNMLKASSDCLVSGGIDISSNEIKKQIEKNGYNANDVDVIKISNTMISNKPVETLPQTSFVKFVQRVFSKLEFKNSNLEVAELESGLEIIIKESKSSQKIASTKQKVVEQIRKSYDRKLRVSKQFVDVKNKFKEKIATSLHNVADRINPINNKDLNISNVDKEELNQKVSSIINEINKEKNANLIDAYSIAEEIKEKNGGVLPKATDKEVDSILEMAKKMRENKTTAVAGSLIGNVPNPNKKEESSSVKM